VLGSPVRHSLSPVLHRAAYDELGLADWTYDAYDVDAAGLAGFLDGLDESWAGLSLTMPLKAAVLTLLDSSSELVRSVGGANTVLLGPDGRHGENTDVPGMVAALRERGVDGVGWACVLGAGSTAAAALAALRELGESTPTVLVRDRGRAAGLEQAAERIGVQPHVEEWSGTSLDAVAGADLVVSTTPAGSTDELAATLPPRLAGTLFDVVYHPGPTALAAAWGQRGGEVLGGLDLLVQQAVLQVGLMTGRNVDVPGLVPLLRAAGQSALRTP
jgi:shikimate dehydrogenase